MGKTLYWVKWVNQKNGMNIDGYFLAESIAQLEDGIDDILEIKVINDVHDLAPKPPTPAQRGGK